MAVLGVLITRAEVASANGGDDASGVNRSLHVAAVVLHMKPLEPAMIVRLSMCQWLGADPLHEFSELELVWSCNQSVTR